MGVDVEAATVQASVDEDLEKDIKAEHKTTVMQVEEKEDMEENTIAPSVEKVLEKNFEKELDADIRTTVKQMDGETATTESSAEDVLEEHFEKDLEAENKNDINEDQKVNSEEEKESSEEDFSVDIEATVNEDAEVGPQEEPALDIEVVTKMPDIQITLSDGGVEITTAAVNIFEEDVTTAAPGTEVVRELADDSSEAPSDGEIQDDDIDSFGETTATGAAAAAGEGPGGEVRAWCHQGNGCPGRRWV